MFAREVMQKSKILANPEIQRLVEWLYGYNQPIKYALEIGVSTGASLACWQTLLESDGILVGVDFNVCDPVYGWRGVMEQTIEKFKDDKRIHLITADSREQETVEKVKDVLGGNLLDFLYIDGEHSFEAATSDYEMYSPLVAENGIIAFHDATRNSNIRKTTESICKPYDLRGSKKFKHICRFDSSVGHCGIFVFVKGGLE